jgi:hypothetical protein
MKTINLQDEFEEEEVSPRVCDCLEDCMEKVSRMGIDDEMVPYIANLWLWGYRTSQCCAGHIEQKRMLSSIYWQTAKELSPDQLTKLTQIQKTKYPGIEITAGVVQLSPAEQVGSEGSRKAAKKTFFCFLDEMLLLLSSNKK